MRVWAALCIALLAAPLLPSIAHADTPDKDACINAHEKAQVERKQRRYMSARKELLVCSNKACPAIAKHDCDKWLNEIDQQLPTVVFEPRAEGKIARDTHVLVDGTEVLDKIEDNVSVPLDPGAHQIRFERSGSKAVQQEVLIVAGEKNRRISMTLDGTPDPSPTSSKPSPSDTKDPPPKDKPEEPVTAKTESKPVPTAAWVLGGVAVVGLATFAVFGLRGIAEEDKLRGIGGCAPECAQTNVDYVDTQYLVADVSLVIGIVSAGVAGWLFFTRGSR